MRIPSQNVSPLQAREGGKNSDINKRGYASIKYKVLEIRYDAQSAFMLDQLGKFKIIKDFVDDCY